MAIRTNGLWFWVNMGAGDLRVTRFAGGRPFPRPFPFALQTNGLWFRFTIGAGGLRATRFAGGGPVPFPSTDSQPTPLSSGGPLRIPLLADTLPPPRISGPSPKNVYTR